MLSDEMIMSVNVLAHFMIYQIFAKAIADLLSTYISVGLSCGNPKCFNKFLNHIAWQTVELAATYSASQVDKVTIACFLEDQVIATSPIKKVKPDVLFLSSKFLPNHYQNSQQV